MDSFLRYVIRVLSGQKEPTGQGREVRFGGSLFAAVGICLSLVFLFGKKLPMSVMDSAFTLWLTMMAGVAVVSGLAALIYHYCSPMTMFALGVIGYCVAMFLCILVWG